MDSSILRNVAVIVFGLLAVGLAYTTGFFQGKSLGNSTESAPTSAAVASHFPGNSSLPQPAATPMSHPSPIFSPSDRSELQQARQKALASQPDLQKEESDLMAQQKALIAQGQKASPQDRQQLFAKWREHSEKMRQAMLTADPNLSRVFGEIDARNHPLPSIAQGQSVSLPAKTTPTK